MTPIASTASTAADTRTGSIFDVRALDNDDVPWLSETDYKSTMTKATQDTHVSGTELKDMILGECLSSYRTKACKSYVRWKRDERARRTVSRKAAPMIGSHQVGDINLYFREPRGSEHELRWNGRSRISVSIRTKKSLGETQPRDSIFVRISMYRLRPCRTAELQVFHHTQTKGSTLLATVTANY